MFCDFYVAIVYANYHWVANIVSNYLPLVIQSQNLG